MYGLDALRDVTTSPGVSAPARSALGVTSSRNAAICSKSGSAPLAITLVCPAPATSNQRGGVGKASARRRASAIGTSRSSVP